MQSKWNDQDAAGFSSDLLAMRVYTSRLLGSDPSLVLHGGGNTSVKATASDVFGEEVEVLYVKGSGWDLATIEAPGFAPVCLETLQRMASLESLSDGAMVTAQRAALTDPYAPNPSVEAILHAIIPFRFVDHSHADAVVALTNTPGGEAIVRDLYGPQMMIVPYVMPGFLLARTIYEMTRNTNWDSLSGMILLNHGVFTFANEARESYEKHIDIVTAAEKYIEESSDEIGRNFSSAVHPISADALLELAELRKAVSETRGHALLASLDNTTAVRDFSELPGAPDLATRGLLTPDHVIRTKRIPMVITGQGSQLDAADYAEAYIEYFARNTDGNLTQLDAAPRWALWPGTGSVAFGATPGEITVIEDIKRHTLRAIGWAEALGGWQPLDESDIFAIEYWELEQAKLKGTGAAPQFQGKVVLVTGGASGIGHACVEEFLAQGAVVAALDISAAVADLYDQGNYIGICCDVTDDEQLKMGVEEVVRRWGGLDVVVCNAGVFPASQSLKEMDADHWDRSIRVNLTSQQRLLQECAPFLALGWEPSVVIIGSKNAPAPGPGAGAYSVAKAGLTQLARIAALEMAQDGIRVNVLHPNAVFDTALWTDDLLQKRAASYGISVDAYKSRNLLGVEVTSSDVAALAAAAAGPVFAKTTGAQIPVDGGNERVI